MEFEKLIVIRDYSDTVIGITDRRKCIKKFIKQNNLKRYVIEEFHDLKNIRYLYNNYSQLFISFVDESHDIVATELQLNVIYKMESEIKSRAIETINNIEYFKNLNLTDKEEKVLADAMSVIKERLSDENIMESCRDLFIYFLSSEGKSLVDEINFLNGEKI